MITEELKTNMRNSIFETFNIRDEYITDSLIANTIETYTLLDEIGQSMTLVIDWKNNTYELITDEVTTFNIVLQD
jgi:hypothetical protein